MLRAAARLGRNRLKSASPVSGLTVRALATEAAPKSGGSGLWLVLGAGAAGGAYYAYSQGMFDGEKSPAALVGARNAKPDYGAVREAISDLLEAEDYDDGSYGPLLVRLAWHSSGSYDKESNTGGSNGATMRFAPEADYGANAGLKVARDLLEGVKKANPWISYADLWTLAGAVAIDVMGGPVIPWRPGRSDQVSGDSCGPDGRLPDATQGAPHLRDIFYRMGFSDQEIVALSGAHSMGRCHPDRSGFKGPWTNAPTTFSNLYFKELLEKKWTKKKWAGPLQYEDPSKELMMLPTDMALIGDKKLKKYVKEYAENEEKFAKDFTAAFVKLLELGVPFDNPGAPAPASPKPTS